MSAWKKQQHPTLISFSQIGGREINQCVSMHFCVPVAQIKSFWWARANQDRLLTCFKEMWVKQGSHNEALVFLGVSLPVSLELRNIWALAHLSLSSRGCMLCLYRVYKVTRTGYTSIVLVFPPSQPSWCVVYCLKPASLCVYVDSFSFLSSYVLSWDPTWSRRRGIGTFCFLMSICVYCTTCVCPPVHACVLVSMWPFICT